MSPYFGVVQMDDDPRNAVGSSMALAADCGRTIRKLALVPVHLNED